MQNLDKLLHQTLRDLPAPTLMELGDYELGLVSAERARAIHSYLEMHPHAAAQFDRLRTYLHQKRVQRRSSRVQPTRSGKRRVWVAERLLSTQLGLKSGAADTFTQGTFQANNVQVVLNADIDEQKSGRIALSGMVIGFQAERITVNLWHDNASTPAATTPLNEFDAFLFEGLAQGGYTVVLMGEQMGSQGETTPATEIHLPTIQL